MTKPVIISGIQPSGKLHIGNYLGALKNFVELQESGKYQCFFFIADLHSLTEEYNPVEKKAQILDAAISYLAAGLTPKKSNLFIQSHVTGHTELSWILNTITPMGELSRMTQFKDKTSRVKESDIKGVKELLDKAMSDDVAKKILRELSELSGGANVGLFSYPVLMAADILLYNSAFVPVGDDQDQHLELTRTLARKFNNRFGEAFIEPKALHTATPRVMSLDEPTKKMSKSRPAGCLFIDDEPEVIKKKVMAAVTDSDSEIIFNPEKKPGISNLLLIVSALTGVDIPSLEKQFQGNNYGQFKSAVATIISDHFDTFRKAKAKLVKKPTSALAPFNKGAAKAQKVAEKKLALVRERVGLL